MVEIYNNLFPNVSLHKDLQTHSTHCMHYFKDTLQFLHWVMKNVFFQRLLQYSNLFIFSGLKWNKLFLGMALLASSRLRLRHVFSARFPGVVLLGWEYPLTSRYFQRLITRKLTGVDPGRLRNLQRRKVEVTRWPK